jgi:hypothetical protein
MKIAQEKLDAFFDVIQGEGITIEEILQLTKLYMGDYRDDILEQETNKKKVTLAMNFIDHASKLVRESQE